MKLIKLEKNLGYYILGSPGLPLYKTAQEAIDWFAEKHPGETLEVDINNYMSTSTYGGFGL